MTIIPYNTILYNTTLPQIITERLIDHMAHQTQGGFLIAKIHQISGRLFARILKKHRLEEINPAQGRILFVLWRNDNIPIQELARRTALEKSTLTSMLDRLAKAGQIEKLPCAGDRRKVLVRLTEKSRSMLETYDQVSEEMGSLFYEGFSGVA